MRPLVVLLLVILAAVALILTLQNSGPTVPDALDTGAVSDTTPQTPAQPGAPGDPNVQAPADNTRVPTADLAPAGVGANLDAVPERPGRNALYGLVMNEQLQPLRGAKVELSRDARMGQEMAMKLITGAPPGGKPLVAITDEKGAYRFANVVPRNDYYLIASHDDYSPTQEALVNVGDEGDFQGPNIILKTGSIVEGTVFDEGDHVVANAELWLESAFFTGEGESSDRLITKSDNLGHFEFKNVYKSTKQLTCSAEGYGTQTKSPVNVGGTVGERVPIEFRLAVGQPIGGKVIGADGAGIKDARIAAHYTGGSTIYRGETLSQEDGSFLLNNLHPGSYILTCQAKGFRQAKNTRVQTGDMNVIIDMLSQACISGRVVDGAGAAVTSFSVSVRRMSPNQVVGPGVHSEETGVKENFPAAADGNFQLCGLDPGTYTLLTTSNNSAPTFSEAFSITAEQPSASVVVRLSRGGLIKGRIVGPGGAPIGGAVVQTYDDTFDEDPTNAGNAMWVNLVPSNITSRRVVTTDAGEFELRFLTPEKYQLRIAHPSFAQGKVRAIIVTDGQPTDVGPIELQVGGTVKGQVVGQGGTPLRGGWVHLESESSDLILDTRSDPEGRYSFTHVRAGNYTLSATVEGSASNDAFGQMDQMLRSQTQIVVTDGGELTRELSLTGG